MTPKQAREELKQVIGERRYWRPVCTHAYGLTPRSWHPDCLPIELRLHVEELTVGDSRNPHEYAAQVNATRRFLALADTNGQTYSDLQAIWAERYVSPHKPHGPAPNCRYCYPRIKPFWFPIDTKLRKLYREFLAACGRCISQRKR